MTDKPFDPVTEGTPTEFYFNIVGKPLTTAGILDLIAARDAAMRRKGLEEAAGILRRKYLDWAEQNAALGRLTTVAVAISFLEDAIRAAAERPAIPIEPPSTAKEGE